MWSRPSGLNVRLQEQGCFCSKTFPNKCRRKSRLCLRLNSIFRLLNSLHNMITSIWTHFQAQIQCLAFSSGLLRSSPPSLWQRSVPKTQWPPAAGSLTHRQTTGPRGLSGDLTSLKPSKQKHHLSHRFCDGRNNKHTHAEGHGSTCPAPRRTTGTRAAFSCRTR